nr:hypothetical protein [Tanacetum cinerariifolium]
EDWPLLPDVPEGRDAINLPPATVDALRDKHYIVGQLQRVIFFEPGVKETDWSTTPVVTGVDGKARRWVYLHYFKEGQPSLNWLDPSFAAQQMIIGDALHAIDVMGARVLRLDANGFLGHALLTGRTEFLRLMLRQVHEFGIDPASLIHALQNHDELTLELVHFWTLHAHDQYLYMGQTFPGNILREHIREEMYERLAGEHAPYNLKFVTNGVSCTTASIITA